MPKDDTMFSAGAAESGAGPAENPPAGDPPAGAAPAGVGAKGRYEQQPETPALPDFIHEKYRAAENPLEAQARAYDEAMKRLTTKTDDLRAEVEAEVRKEFAAPEKPDDYKLPEDWQGDHPLAGAAIEAFHKAGFTQAQLDAALETYRQATTVDVDAEKARLGSDADTRLSRLNGWLTRTVPKEQHDAVARMMQSADGALALEAIMRAATDTSSLPDPGAADPTPKHSREGLRSMMTDPRYADARRRDAKYVEEVNAYARALAAAGG